MATIITKQSTTTLSSGWMGILTGIWNQKLQRFSLAEQTDDGFYSLGSIVLEIDETAAFTARDAAGASFPGDISHFYNDRPKTGDTLVVDQVVATYGRQVMPLTSRGVLVELVPLPEPGAGNLAVVEGRAKSELEGDRLVFTLTMLADGTYTLQMIEGIDHPKPDETDEALNLFFTYQLNNKALDALMVRVHDDTPVYHRADFPVIVDETDYVAPTDLAVTGATGEVDLDFGVDGAAAADNAPVTVTAMWGEKVLWGEVEGERVETGVERIDELTSHGAPVWLRTDSSTPGVAVAEGWIGEGEDATLVFRFEIDAYGEDHFYLYEPLDHPAAGDDSNGEHDDRLRIVFDLLIKDFDGDVSEARTSVEVADDGPAAQEQVALVNVRADHEIHEQDGVGLHKVMVGEFIHDFGTEGPKVDASVGNAAGGVDVLAAWVHDGDTSYALSAGGELVVFERDADDGHVLWGRVGERDILKLTVDTVGQTVSYEQIAGIDHPDPDSPDELVDLSFDLRLTDTDGDYVDTTVTVADVHDGAPVAMHDTDKTVKGQTTTGNLITGVDPDTNQVSAGEQTFEFSGRLARDGQGSDEVFLRSFTHAGVVYTLNEAGDDVDASDGSANHTFDAETGLLTLQTGLGGSLSIDLLGDGAGDYSYTAPTQVDKTTTVTIDGENFDSSELQQLGISLRGYAPGGELSTVVGGAALSVGDGDISGGEELLLNLGGRLASSIDVALANGEVVTMPPHQLYRYGSEVDSLVTDSSPFTFNLVAAIAPDTDTYQVDDLAFSLDDENLGAGDYNWSQSFSWPFNAGGSFGQITGTTYTVGGYSIDMPWPSPDIWIPEVEIDTRNGLAVNLTASGAFGMSIGFKYSDYSYDLNTSLDTSILPPTDPSADTYYDFNSTTQIASQKLDLNPASWEFWIGLDIDVDLSGSYEARIPYYGVTGDIEKIEFIDYHPEKFIAIGQNSQGLLYLTLLDFPIIGPGFGAPNDAGGFLDWPIDESFGYDASGHTEIFRKVFNLPTLYKGGFPAGTPGVLTDYMSVVLYNWTNLMQAAASTVQNNSIHASAESLVAGVFADLDGLLGWALGKPGLFGGQINYNSWRIRYDAIDVDFGPVFGIKQTVDVAPDIMVNLEFSVPVYVDGQAEPVRELLGQHWNNLPGIKPVGDEPVTVTPSFYYGSNVSQSADANLNLGLEIDVLALSLGYKLTKGVTFPLAGIGPLFSYDNYMSLATLGQLWGSNSPLIDPTQLYDDLANFVFPLAPNPFPNSGIDLVSFDSTDAAYAIDEITVNFDPAGFGKEFFSYVLEDADGDQSSANFAISISDELPKPDEIRLSQSSVSEAAAGGALVGQLSAYAMGASLGAVYGDLGTFELLDDAGGLFSINMFGQLLVAGPLDFESETSHQITVKVTNVDGASWEQQFTIGVTDANEAPQLPATAFDIDEGFTGEVGTVLGTDPDAADTLTYRLVNGDGRFTIDADTGVISLSEALRFDSQNSANNEITLVVQVQDAGGLTGSDEVTVSVLDVNLVPEEVTLYDNLLFRDLLDAESPNRIVGALSATDPDPGDVVGFSVIAGGDLFEVVDGVLQAKAGASLSSGNYDVTIRASDRLDPAQALFIDKTFTVEVKETDAAAPTAVVTAPEALQLEENAAAGTVVAILSLDDADGEIGYFNFAEEGGVLQDADGRFVLVGRELRVAEGADLNFEELTSHTVTIVGSDYAGHAVTQTLEVTLTDINEAPLAAPDLILTTQIDGTLALPYFALGHNDHDDDSDVLSYSAFMGMTPATWVFNDTAQQLEIPWPAVYTQTNEDGEVIVVADHTNGLYSVSDGAIDVLSFAWVEQEETTSLIGTAASEILVGTGAAESLDGGDGKDVLIGAGGADTMAGGNGDDLFVLADMAWISIDGGAGLDTLRLVDGYTGDLDLRAANSAASSSVLDQVSSIESVDLRDGSVNALLIDKDGILALSDRVEIQEHEGLTYEYTLLIVRGDSGDSLDLDQQGNAWEDVQLTVQMQGVDYQIWQNVDSAPYGSSVDMVGVMVLVEVGVDVV